MSEHHPMPKTTVTQFLLAVVGALVPVLIVAVLITGHIRHYVAEFGAPDAEKDGAAVAERLKPVAEITVASADAAPAQAGAAADGKKVFEGTCVACHGAGVAGAPKVGDKAAWGPRIAQGKDTLYKHALGGFQGKSGMMPAKGGNAGLPDDDVKAAVDFMVSQSK